MQEISKTQTTATEASLAPADWETAVNVPRREPKTAEFVEGGVYRAKVLAVVFEQSRKYPGWRYPRIKFIAYDEHGGSKPVSWIPWEREDVVPAFTAIDPDARGKNSSAFVGQECCVRITLQRGVTATKILPKSHLSGPTLAQQGLL